MTGTSRYGRVLAVAVACLVVAGTTPALAGTGGSEPTTGTETERTAPEQSGRTSVASQAFEDAAREGAERALATVEDRGVAVSEELRSAVVQGAVLGAELASAEGAQFPSAPPDDVRAAAYGAAYGALQRSSEGSPNADVVRNAVAGGVAGAALTSTVVAARGGNATLYQLQSAAQGGSEGAVAAVGRLSQEQRAPLTDDHVLLAALGAAAGSVGGAGLLPIFGETVDGGLVYSAALGSSWGAVEGTAAQLGETGRVNTSQTLAAAMGASGGAVSATVRDQGLTGDDLLSATYTVAFGTVRRADELTQDQMLETALTDVVDRLLGDVTGDAVFPRPIVVESYVAIGPPLDPDSDGRYEDVNGNRVLTYSDVVSFAIIQSSYAQGRLPLSDSQLEALDFNDDGVLDERDTRALDEEVSAVTNESA